MHIYRAGFSLLELLIVVTIVVVVSTLGVGFYSNYGKGIEVSSVASSITFDLKLVQSKAMGGEGSFKWGIHFVNSTADYYELFSTPTDYNDGGKVILSTVYLSSGVEFSDPANGVSEDIIFNRISGRTSAASVSMVSRGITKTVDVSALGTISVQ